MSEIVKKTLFLIAILWMGVGSISGQVDPPDFNCVQNDTLIWEKPNPACGPVQGYEIYFSEQLNGSFTLLATINDPDSLKYFHDHLSDETFYYYILTLADCPGESPVPSDTLDNQPPRPPVIEAVSVINGNVAVNWSPSISPETIGYIIYRATSLGTVPIDTVFNGTNYIDNQAFPETEEQYYYVLSLDDCGNTSIFDTTHHTIFLTAGIDSCRQSANLEWSLYENWRQGIKDHIIYVQEDGGSEYALDTIAPKDSTYTITGLSDSTQYCITVEARENQTGERSRSNQLCFTPDIVEPMDFLYLLNATVNAQNQVSLTWEWDDAAELKTIEMLREREDVIETFSDILPVQGLMAQQQYTDNTFGTYNQPMSYWIQTVDGCDSTVRSNPVETIYLEGDNGQGASNLLQWNAFSSPLSTVQSYELYAVSGGSMTSIASLPPDSLQYRHVLDVSQAQNASVCYKIEALHEVDIPGQPPRVFNSRSNVVCLDQNVTVYVPNAFAPQGTNQFFKPVFTFPQNISSYSMRIYNRFGGEVFNTTSIDDGWYGQDSDGSNSPAGVYVYLLQWETTNGIQREKRGTVLLIR